MTVAPLHVFDWDACSSLSSQALRIILVSLLGWSVLLLGTRMASFEFCWVSGHMRSDFGGSLSKALLASILTQGVLKSLC